MKNKSNMDFSGFFDSAYSYERPAWIVLNGLCNGMIDAGFTVEEVQHWIYSKEYRWALDQKLGEMLQECARKYGASLKPSEWMKTEQSPNGVELVEIKKYLPEEVTQ